MSVKEMYINSQNTIEVKEITFMGKLNNPPRNVSRNLLFTIRLEIS
jgi:hypothetical protein